MKITFEGSEYQPGDLAVLRKIYPQSGNLLDFMDQWLHGSNTFSFQSSGSTGAPKLIKVSRKQIVASIEQTAQYLSLRKTDKALLCLDPGFVASLMMAARCLYLGMDLILRKPSSNPMSQKDFDVDFASFVPFQIYQMISDQSLGSLTGIRNILIGGAPLTREAFHQLAQINTNIYQTYGMTETVSHIALKRVQLPLNEAYFKILPGITVETDGSRCLKIKGAVTSHQWIQTNDIVSLHGIDQFQWLGRLDHVINSGGVKIHPEQIEQAIAPILSEHQAYFIGSVTDQKLGQRCVLFLEGDPLTERTFELIQKKIADAFSNYHRPKEMIAMESFVRTSTGKLNRKETMKQRVL